MKTPHGTPTFSALLGGLVLLTSACDSAAARGPRNVLWICIDTLRADRLGCYGHDRPTSPHLDALAERGFVFEQAYSQSPWTKPSVPSMFTGRYPAEHGVFEGSSKDEAGRVTSDVLGESWTTAAEVFKAEGYRTAGFVHNAHLRGFLGFAQGFDVYRDQNRRAREIVREFQDWVVPGDARPFFAYLHLLDVHWPYQSTGLHRGLFPSPEPRLDLSERDAGDLREQINRGAVLPGPDDIQAMQALYDGCIRETDEALGELFAWLDLHTLGENTIMIITSDHGEEFFEHGQVGHGHSLRDSLLRVPWIVAGPGVVPGRAADLVEMVDVLPTLVELLDLGVDLASSGTSHAVQLEGGASVRKEAVFAEVLHGRTYQRSIRTARWKLIERYQQRDAGNEGIQGRLAIGPGQRVEVKGRFEDEPGWFEADRLQIEDSPDRDAEVRGPLTRISADDRLLWIGPLALQVDPDTMAKVRSGARPRHWSELEVGQVIDADGELTPDGRLRVDKIEWRDDKNSSTIQLEGIVTHVDIGMPSITLLGMKVEFEDEVPLPGLTRTRRQFSRREEDLSDRWQCTRAIELYDLDQDPVETFDRAAEHEGVAVRLALELSRHAAAHQRGEAAPQAELSGEILDDLRAIGYLGEADPDR